MHERHFGCTRHLLPSAAAVAVTWMRVNIGTRIAAVVERQPGAMADFMRHLICQPQTLARTDEAHHSVHHVMMHMAVKNEVAF